MLVVSGVNAHSTEILIKNPLGNYVSSTQERCSVENFPVNTSSATGAVFRGSPHVCVGYKEGRPSNQCYGLTSKGSWDTAFQLENPLSSWGSSVLFAAPNSNNSFWWFVGGDPDGNSTEVVPEIGPVNFEPELPAIINQPCMVKLNDQEAFISARPKFEASNSNFAWIYNIYENSWKSLPNSLQARSGPSCGLLQNSSGRYIVLAGGYKRSSTEILNLDTMKWSPGPNIGNDLFGGSMVSVMDGQELILIGGYITGATTKCLRMDSSMASWKWAGSLNKARFNAVAMAVSIEHLSNLDLLC